MLYYSNSLNGSRRLELEGSHIETLWSWFTLPNTRPCHVCTVYRPPNAQSEWIELFEEELSIAQTTGLEIILMGDFNSDYSSFSNRKWLSFVQLFDLCQLVKEPIRITELTATIIDHVYTTHPEHITECFISYFSISYHFPICITRKVNCKVSKNDHITTSYHCFKQFGESIILTDQNDLIFFSERSPNLDEDFSTWHRSIMKHLDNHAPVNTKRVQHKRLPEWYTPEIAQIQRLRDNCKRRKQWSDFKRYRNKARHLIRSAKRKYFTDLIISSKDSKFIWRHLRSVNNNTKTSSDSLPNELFINGETVMKSENIAAHLNEYFSSIAEIFNETSDQTSELDTDRLRHFANSKIPDHIFFSYSTYNVRPSIILYQ